ncbi:MAG: MFS transporter [Planctomycetota bacterium]
MVHAPMDEWESREIEPRAKSSATYKWAVVGMLWFICFFNYADRQAVYSVFPLLEEEFQFTKTEQGWIAAAFMWVYALTAPFAGQVGDRFSRKYVILAGLFVWSAVTGFTAICSKVWQFVFVRGAEGLGETVYFPASMSLISDYHGKSTRSRAMSFHQTSVYAGTIGGGWLAGWMGLHYGWRVSFVVLAVAGILLGLVLAAFIREPKRNQAELEEAGHQPKPNEATETAPIGPFLWQFFTTPTAMLLIVAFIGANSVAAIFLSWMPTFLKEKYALDLASAGFGATFYLQTASMVGAIAGGVMADWARQRMPGGRVCVQSLGLFLGAPFVFACGYTTNLWLLAGAMTMMGLFKGIYDSNIWASLYDVVIPSRRGTAVGIMNMIGWIGGGLGTTLVGVVVDRGVTMSEAISATAVVYAATAMLLLAAGLLFAPRDVIRVHGAA